VANRDGEGVFLRVDGKEIPDDILDDTFEFLEKVHEDLNKFAREEFDPEDIPKSVGHYFESEFKTWLQVQYVCMRIIQRVPREHGGCFSDQSGGRRRFGFLGLAATVL
jgi:hypothetical protein